MKKKNMYAYKCTQNKLKKNSVHTFTQNRREMKRFKKEISKKKEEPHQRCLNTSFIKALIKKINPNKVDHLTKRINYEKKVLFMGFLIVKVIMNYQINKLVSLINDNITSSNKDNDSIINK